MILVSGALRWWCWSGDVKVLAQLLHHGLHVVYLSITSAISLMNHLELCSAILLEVSESVRKVCQ